jgi:two-component system NarL family response regulator
MKVLLVDDSKLFLAGLRNMLEDSDIEVLGTALSAQEAIEETKLLQPEIVLMDVQMPGESGIEATCAIKALFPATKIVMMTVSESDEHLYDAIVAGASGYLLKSMPPTDFLEALVGMSRDETPLSPGLASKIMAEFARRSREKEASGPPLDAEELSPRQTRILHLVAQGWTYKKIAESMDIHERTVKYHIREITGKLRLKNRSQVLVYASQHFAVNAPGVHRGKI